VEYAHAMNISHNELTWPLGLQQEVQEDLQAKMRAAQRGDGGPFRPILVHSHHENHNKHILNFLRLLFCIFHTKEDKKQVCNQFNRFHSLS